MCFWYKKLKGRGVLSKIISKNIVCPQCSEEAEAKLYLSVNVTNSPDLKNDLISGKLVNHRCEVCGSESHLAYPILYNDMKKRVMVYLIPEVDCFQLADKQLEEKYSDVSGVTKRIVPDFNSLKEKIFIYDCGLDDMAVEITKLAISQTVAKKLGYDKIEQGYLSLYNSEENTMGFTFFTGKQKEPYVQSARLEVYTKALDIVDETVSKDKKLKGFIKIDREWAENVLYRYKHSKISKD